MSEFISVRECPDVEEALMTWVNLLQYQIKNPKEPTQERLMVQGYHLDPAPGEEDDYVEVGLLEDSPEELFGETWKNPEVWTFAQSEDEAETVSPLPPEKG